MTFIYKKMARTTMANTKTALTKMAHSKMVHAKMAQNGRLSKMAQWSHF